MSSSSASSSSSLSVLQGLPELLQISREYALLGQYQTSLTYYDGFNAQLNQFLVRVQCMRTLAVMFF